MCLNSSWQIKIRGSIPPHLSAESLGAGATQALLEAICVRSHSNFTVKSLGAGLKNTKNSY